MARKSRLRSAAVKPAPAATIDAAGESTQAPPPEPLPLPARLLNEPWDYRFFQAVRLLQLISPQRAPIGRFAEPAHEAVRFTSHQTLSHPPSEIHSFEEKQDSPHQLSVNFMGLTGPVGELPVAYTSHVIARLQAGDSTIASFFDIFNHRMVSLFYRAWERYRFTIPYERGEMGGLTQYMLDFLGLGTPGLQDRQEVGDQSLIYYSGLLTQRPRSAQSLRQILQDYFEVPVEIIQFIGAWRKLDRNTICILDDNEEFAPASSRLGLGAVAGDEVWDPQSIVRIRLGPLTLNRYLEFLPNGSAYPALRAIARFFAGQELDFEVQLVLKREEAVGVQLGVDTGMEPQLGWLSWIKSVPMDRDPDDTVYRLWEEEPSSYGR